MIPSGVSKWCDTYIYILLFSLYLLLLLLSPLFYVLLLFNHFKPSLSTCVVIRHGYPQDKRQCRMPARCCIRPLKGERHAQKCKRTYGSDGAMSLLWCFFMTFSLFLLVVSLILLACLTLCFVLWVNVGSCFVV